MSGEQTIRRHPTHLSTSTSAGTKHLAWAVLAAAVLQALAPVVTIWGPGTSPGGDESDLLITPAGWAFSIWGVIYALAIAQALAAVVTGSGTVPRRLQIDLLVLYVGATVWIQMAALESSLATAATLLVMFAAAADAVLTVARHSAGGDWFVLLTRSAVGLYAGWVTAAVFLNLGTALVDPGPLDAADVLWQLVLLGAAGLTLIALTAATRGLVAYAVAGCWAMLGIIVTGLSEDTTSVVVVAATAAIALVVGTAVALHRRTSAG